MLGCWSPWALGRPWVQTECAIGKDENKLVAIERVTLTAADVPALFYLVDRKPLSDFDGTAPHEGWAMTLSALATKLKLWVEKRPDHPEVAAVREKIVVLEKAAAAERAALGAPVPVSDAVSAVDSVSPVQEFERAWSLIEKSLEPTHYSRFERAFERIPSAFFKVMEAEARVKALERWAATDQKDIDAIAETLRTGLFPALQHVAEQALARAEDAARQREAAAAKERERQARETAEKNRRLALSQEERDFEDVNAYGYLNSYVGDAEYGFGRLLAHFGKYPSIDPRKAKSDQKYADWYFGAYLPTGDHWHGKETSSFRDALDAHWRPKGRIKVEAPLFSPPDSAAAYAGWLKPGAGKIEWFKDLGIGPEMVVVPGNPAFAIGQFAVTFAEWDAAQAHPEWRKHAKIEPRKASDHGWGRGKQPVIDVSWNDAKAYCAWASAVTGKTYRLPSEAEWEQACRAGTKTEFWWGNKISTAQANYDGNYTFGNGKKGEYRQRTMPVDSFEANPWGLYQVHGNVCEWCEDAYEASSRVVRGGSWNYN